MEKQMTLAQSPEELSAVRARIFLDGANEIARVDVVKKSELIVGRIGVVLDAIHKALGASEREFARADGRVHSLLAEAYKDSFGVTIKNPVHLYNELKRNICRENEIYGSTERDKIERFIRKIAGKLVNGHAGVYI